MNKRIVECEEVLCSRSSRVSSPSVRVLVRLYARTVILKATLNLLNPTGHVMHQQFNLLKPTGHVMRQQFNIQQLYVLPTLYLCVLCLSENKQRLVPLTA